MSKLWNWHARSLDIKKIWLSFFNKISAERSNTLAGNFISPNLATPQNFFFSRIRASLGAGRAAPFRNLNETTFTPTIPLNKPVWKWLRCVVGGNWNPPWRPYSLFTRVRYYLVRLFNFESAVWLTHLSTIAFIVNWIFERTLSR